MEEQDIEYDYTVDEVRESGEVVITYTPVDARLKAVTRTVPVPFHKARDADHAEQILETKARGRAPTQEWVNALAAAAAPPTLGREAGAAALRERVVGQQRQVRKTERLTREERLRRDFLA